MMPQRTRLKTVTYKRNHSAGFAATRLRQIELEQRHEQKTGHGERQKNERSPESLQRRKGHADDEVTSPRGKTTQRHGSRPRCALEQLCVGIDNSCRVYGPYGDNQLRTGANKIRNRSQTKLVGNNVTEYGHDAGEWQPGSFVLHTNIG